ncbi:Beta N-acetyl-glucosaminidase [Rubellimicrobium mesophilum DSM 19309]|uniref:beta-N-acetylhexosaminidase n=1 Tax=Rubellimicrobium mesophilum DSM 19309 TaxID=442562 RepID=A0A017HNZ2_9RHOB|nr:glycoside hydrolase family 3 N-terminal domain-containing protein [Rubellimicrobium mesophilum]EYD76222.1 Beta N-acetyl-glucosaminidase [Rubellimicrobium mesophilum DSM 19309]
MPLSAILGVSGTSLDAWERGFLRDADPWGFILFARNVEDPDQLRRLTAELRDTVGRDAPILIDQEGGRVQRMRPPFWREYLPALTQMERATEPLRAQWVRNRLIAAELQDVGIDVNCVPLADLVEDGTHPILRNRLYGADIPTVVTAARACAQAHLAGGVLPVLKHIPGYGRARVDSHLDLPRVSVGREVLQSRDFAPFRALRDLPLGMTAHIVFDAVDPDRPCTTSPVAIRMIREEIGFDGLLMTDDIGMEALTGTMAERAAASLAAGVDLVLYCKGERPDLVGTVSACHPLEGPALERAVRALALRRPPEPVDIAALAEELHELLPEGA